MKAFTVIELMLTVAIIVVLVGIAVAGYRKAKWNSGIVDGAIENRGRLNQAVADGSNGRTKQA